MEEEGVIISNYRGIRTALFSAKQEITFIVSGLIIISFQ